MAQLAVVTEVRMWEYNDAGFSGFRDRDHMTLDIRVEDVAAQRVVSRAIVRLRSDFGILDRYADRFVDEARDEDRASRRLGREERR